MKNVYLILIVLGMLVLGACNSIVPDEQELANLKGAPMVMNFTAHLSGDEEVPANESMAVGEAVFQLSKDGMELSYKLIVAKLDNIRMSHIHLAPAGANGGVVVWLYPSAPPAVTIPGTSNGILAMGVITADNLTGALAGQPLWSLVEELQMGGAYVNVHTDQYPGGEIRGQIMYGPGNAK
ncbi:CHRD domain-containing protein [Mangrovibacterium lignilyticum]|uniref:CHRD domain-containing protein n=1 Tax=Mangrovibacterium lignilyticum TaxID=2668052 RepID=UPI001967FB59|nr:CHRD domain-containing protein [Mangrovibacterium lignilyticum]